MSPRRGPQLPYSTICGATPWGKHWVTGTAKIGGAVFALETPRLYESFSEILSESPSFSIVVVNAPIGYTDGPEFEPRSCDIASRALLGKRGSTIKNAPNRAVLNDQTGELKTRLDAVGLKLLARYREVAELVSPYRQRVVYEGHPELSFYQLNSNKPLRYSKNKEEGKVERLILLEQKIPEVSKKVEEASETIPQKYVLDAIALLWTARRVFGHAAQRVPPDAEWDSEGLRVERVL
jgi:predicted RNase H-like nuclease